MQGLMFHKHIAAGDGMIFEWNGDSIRSFWMENTYIPLDIIYVNSSDNVVSIGYGVALSKTSVPSMGVAKYAVEANAGFAKQHGIKSGMKARFAAHIAPSYFVATDDANFGATEDDIQIARAAHVY
eukprot:GEMP01102226.1.p1 GENE.GEMP01102226.1~~GEMP01102226.1.p1  ORF type:complete len:126 (-),score=23.01 GEMP01102226.1:97-474(-)